MTMFTTSVFSKNLKAYTDGASLIVNQGGTRSSKSYSIMQLLLEIALASEKKLIISVVSQHLPHLKLGVMRDFDSILLSRGIVPDNIKHKSENYYRVGKSIIEFFGVDNLGKVHGPARDILFINEANYIKEPIFDQLAIRTKGAIFIDFNPTQEFWFHKAILGKRDFAYIKSTYLDNEFLTHAQIVRIEEKKVNAEWWKVYGEGELGRLEGAIFTNWKYGEFDNALPYIYGMDFGVNDPDTLVKVAIDKKNKLIYVSEELYQNDMSTDTLFELIKSRGVGRSLIVADSAGERTIIDLRKMGLNIVSCSKKKIVEDIKAIKNYTIIVTENSYNLASELNSWVWLDKNGEVPLDDHNHAIDPIRYAFNKLTQTAPTSVKVMHHAKR